MSVKLFNTHIHAHTEHKAGSGPLTGLAGSMSLLNINKNHRARQERKICRNTKKKKKRVHFRWRLHRMLLEFQKALEKVRNSEVMREAKQRTCVLGVRLDNCVYEVIFLSEVSTKILSCLLSVVCSPTCHGKKLYAVVLPLFDILPPSLQSSHFCFKVLRILHFDFTTHLPLHSACQVVFS